MTVGVCLKWVDRRPELGEHGVTPTDARFAGVSAADQSALECALRSAADDEPVVAVTVGPPGAAAILRDAVAAGTTSVVHLVATNEIDSATTAAALATVLNGCRLVWCGDYSLDRGSGSVPAFLAAELDAAQALGLVAVEPDGDALVAVRRLDGGRRERLRVRGPAVLSVEGNVAPLRRAGLAAALRARDAVIDSRPLPTAEHERRRISRPYRPRPRVLPPPSGSSSLARIQVLTDAAGAPVRNETLTLSPGEAAHHILAVLADWGYLPPEVL